MNCDSKKIYSAIKIVVFFLIVFLLIAVAAKVTQRKDSISKYQDFMELSDQIDVLLLGSSHMMNGVNPVQLYAEYGITAYNMAKPGGMVTESYWMLMNALDYCTPECVVIDLWALDRDYKYLDIMNGHESEADRKNSVSLLHTNMDFLPLSKTKIAAVNDLISDPEIRKEFLWDFTLYHDRWSSLTKNDFQSLNGNVASEELLGAVPEKGIYAEIGLQQPENSGAVIPEDTVCVQYLYKILDECKDRGIEVMMTFIPMAVSYEQDWMAVNTAIQIAEERNVAFLNMLPQETQSVIDYYTDMVDESHVNTNGMRKLTSYIGKQLMEHIGFEDHREDPAYAAWGEKVSRWQGAEINSLLGRQELYVKLGQIQNVNANVIIFMPGGSQALQDSTVRRFIKQLTHTTVVDDAAAVTGPYLLMRDTEGAVGGALRNTEFAGEIQPEVFSTILGNIEYIGLNNFAAVYANGDFGNNYLDMEEHYNSDIQILILGQEGEEMSHFYYNPDWKNMKMD